MSVRWERGWWPRPSQGQTLSLTSRGIPPFRSTHTAAATIRTRAAALRQHAKTPRVRWAHARASARPLQTRQGILLG